MKLPAQKAARVRRTAPEVTEPETVVGKPYPIVGVGASAGWPRGLRESPAGAPADTGMAFVLVQHLDPAHESQLADLLSRATAMPVTEVQEGTPVEPEPRLRHPAQPVDGDQRRRPAPDPPRGARDPAPADRPFPAVARRGAGQPGHRRHPLGNGSDGTHGLLAIKAAGGITFAQDEKSAKYDGMPRSAVAAGCVDFVLPPERIARELARIATPSVLGHAARRRRRRSGARRTKPPQQIFEAAPPTPASASISRTTSQHHPAPHQRRMVLHKLGEPQGLRASFSATHRPRSQDAVQRHPDPRDQLLPRPESFEALQPEGLPRADQEPPARGADPRLGAGLLHRRGGLLDRHVPDGVPRPTAARPLPDPDLRHRHQRRRPSSKARAGVYPESISRMSRPSDCGVSSSRCDGGYRITKSIRDVCVFARQDLAERPALLEAGPDQLPQRADLPRPAAAEQVMAIFHYALKPGGFLMLGKSETVGGYAHMFATVDTQHKLYTQETGRTPAVFHTLTEPTPAQRAGQRRREASEHPPARCDVQNEADRIILPATRRRASSSTRTCRSCSSAARPAPT